LPNEAVNANAKQLIIRVLIPFPGERNYEPQFLAISATRRMGGKEKEEPSVPAKSLFRRLRG